MTHNPVNFVGLITMKKKTLTGLVVHIEMNSQEKFGGVVESETLKPLAVSFKNTSQDKSLKMMILTKMIKEFLRKL